jgi:tRNA threonylcarbamoyladenosine biosynthesis protein TsaE
MLVITKSAEETKALAQSFMQGLIREAVTSTCIVELVGDLGAGKTTFMQGVGEFFGVTENIVSPTFVIQRNYEIPSGFPWDRLIHIDAYRIEDEAELRAIAFEGYASDPRNIIFIEWPSNMKTELGAVRRVEFTHKSENEREIKI